MNPLEDSRLRSKTLELALQKHGGSNRELAENAGISFRAIAEARNGFAPEDLKKPKKQLGVVSSLTRLAVFLNEDPKKILADLGIDATDATVQRHLERAIDTSNPDVAHDDCVFRAIKARTLVDPKGPLGPLVGIAPWSPFSMAERGGASVATALARTILGSLNPEWDRDRNVLTESSFAEAERRLLLDDLDTPDLVVGLYDLPWRRTGDVEITPLPGLYVRLGGLCTRETSWREIITGEDGLPHVIVIDGDVGDKLISGPVDYPQKRIRTPRLQTRDPREIAEYFRQEFARRLPDGLALIGDGPLLAAVKSLLGDLSPELKELSDRSSVPWAPVYGFGFATRYDAHRFRPLLEEAISQDLLGRVFPRTVQLYLDLLEGDWNNQIQLNLSELCSRLHPNRDTDFIEIARTLKPHLNLCADKIVDRVKLGMETRIE